MKRYWKQGVQKFYSFFCFSILIKFTLWIVDDTPRFLFGDSYSYIATSWGGYLPNDRSWTYGLLFNALVKATGSFSSILFFQSCVSAVAIALVAVVISGIFRSAIMGYVICAVTLFDPLIIYYDRSVTTDSLAASIFSVVVICFYYSIYGKRAHAAVARAMLLATVTIVLSLRVAYVPVLMGLGVVCVSIFVLSRFIRPRNLNDFLPSWSGSAAITASIIPAAFVLTMGINAVVNHSMGFTLNAKSGMFTLGTLAPAIEYPMLEEAGFKMSQERFDELDLRNRAKRNAQMFWPQGLVASLVSQLGNMSEKDQDARLLRLSNIVLRERPGAVIILLVRQLIDQLNPASYTKPVDDYLVNQRPFENDFAINHVNPFVWQKLDKDLPREATTAQQYLISLRLWIWFNFLFGVASPLGIPLMRGRVVPLYALLALSSAGYAVSSAFFSIGVILRYYLPVEILNVAAATLAVGGILRWRREGPTERIREQTILIGKNRGLR